MGGAPLAARQAGRSRASALLLHMALPLLPALPDLSPDERDQVEAELERALAAQTAAMPLYLGAPFRAALVVFEWLPMLRFVRRYTQLDRSTQARVMAAWSNAPLPPLRDFVKLVRSCALYHYLDHPVVVARLESEDAGG